MEGAPKMTLKGDPVEGDDPGAEEGRDTGS
jgi:hypothetical protein